MIVLDFPGALQVTHPESSLEAATRAATLFPGKVLEARVLEKGADGRLLVRFEGCLAWARSTICLEPGQKVRVVVVQVAPEITLRLLESGHPEGLDILAGCARRGLPWMGWEEMGKLMEDVLKQLGNAASLLEADGGSAVELTISERHRDPSWILRASGLLLEAKLARACSGQQTDIWPDLKARVLQLTESGQDGRFTVGPWKNLLRMVEGIQAMASLAQQGGHWEITVPLVPWWMPGGSWGDLRVKREGSSPGQRQKGGWAMILRLELNERGRLMVRLWLQAGTLDCELWASDPRMRELLLGGVPSLEERLRGLGLVEVRCSVSALEEQRQWEQEISPIPMSLVGVLA